MRQRARRKDAKDFTGMVLTHGTVLGELSTNQWQLECKYCGEVHIVDSRVLYCDRHTRKCSAWSANGKKHTALNDQDRWLRKKYGIDFFQYSQLLAAQGGGCAICGVTKERNGKSLSVDHCHTTGKIRGILCHSCNTGIGAFLERTTAMAAAVDYLNKHARNDHVH